MNFEDEAYVKVYKRQTLGMKLSGWDGRAVLRAVFMHVDRAGVLDLDGLSPAEAIAALEDMPLEVAAPGMAKLLARGTVAVHENVLFIPNFIPGQEAKQSDAQRQRESRAARAAKLRAYKLGLPVTKRDEPFEASPPPASEPANQAPTEPASGTHQVTNRDEQSDTLSRNVTERSEVNGAGHSEISSADQRTAAATTTQRPDPLVPTAPAALVVVEGRVPCPADLELTPAQRSQLTMGKGMTDYQVDELCRRFRTSFTADPDDQRPLVAWRKCMAQWVSGTFTNPRHRPPRSPDEETPQQTADRLRRGPRQPIALDHSTDEAHLRAIGGRTD